MATRRLFTTLHAPDIVTITTVGLLAFGKSCTCSSKCSSSVEDKRKVRSLPKLILATASRAQRQAPVTCNTAERAASSRSSLAFNPPSLMRVGKLLQTREASDNKQHDWWDLETHLAENKHKAHRSKFAGLADASEEGLYAEAFEDNIRQHHEELLKRQGTIPKPAATRAAKPKSPAPSKKVVAQASDDSPKKAMPSNSAATITEPPLS